MVEQKLQVTVSKSVELLPELWKQAGAYQEALTSYRRALLSQWNLDDESCTRIQKRFAVFLLYCGIEASPPSLASQTEGSFVPRNNLEEAILLLMILLKKWFLGKTYWDPSLMEHLTFALSLCDQTFVLAKHLEEILPGIYPRTERWYSLALSYFAASDNEAALNLLQKMLNKNESPNDIMALLLSAKICSSNYHLSSEGVDYARRAVKDAESSDGHLKSIALHFLGSCLAKNSKIVCSDYQRSILQIEALKSLNEARSLDHNNPEIIFDMGVEYAEQHTLHAALKCAKDFIDATGGSVSKGWRLLSLVLSAQQRYSEAEVVTDAALDETAKWEQGPLLRIRAKLKVAQSLPMEAVEAYRALLALVQAQRKAYGTVNNGIEVCLLKNQN
jgi:tetratricopeptide repeat protein 7